MRTFAALLAFALARTDASYSYLNDDVAFMGLNLDVCEDSVVAITYMNVLCDSPYTFYYGNGANRNSRACDYGDKASLSVAFTVLDDLQEDDTEIFVTMAAFDDSNNMLTSTYPERLCHDLVGVDCTKAGSYYFETKLKFNSISGNRTKFIPVVHMAFSTKSDSGYNLGAVNIECMEWDQDQPVLVAWSGETQRTSIADFMFQYGMLILACVMLTTTSAFVWIRSHDNPGFDHFPPYVSDHHSGETSFIEM